MHITVNGVNGRRMKVMNLVCTEFKGKDHQMEEDGKVMKMSCQCGEEQRGSEAAILDVVKHIAVGNFNGINLEANVLIVLLSQKFDVSTSSS